MKTDGPVVFHTWRAQNSLLNNPIPRGLLRIFIHPLIAIGLVAVLCADVTSPRAYAATPWFSTNLSLASKETVSLTMAATAGTMYTLDVAATNHVAVYVRDPSDQEVGKALSAYGLTWTASQDGSNSINVVNGPKPTTCQLNIYTNALPFYRAETNPDEDRPDFMTNRWYKGTQFGHVFVPADRSESNRHSFRLPVLLMPGGPTAMNAPLVFLSGGPGSSALEWASLFSLFTNTCPVIIVNQRGTFLSQPNLFSYSPDETTLELQERLGGPDGLDFNTINTRQNAADILDLMTALGHHEPFNLWGTSYGTMLAQEVIRQAPDRIRAAVLDGVVTMDQNQWTAIAQTFYDALRALADDIAQHAAAGRFYPDFGRELLDYAATLYPDGHSDFFDQLLHVMNLSRWGYAENIPLAIWRAARGQTAALDELGAIRLLIPDPTPDGPISLHMYCAVLRQDFLPFESMAAAAALTNTIPFPLNMHGYIYSKDQYDLSEDWAFLEPAPADFRRPVTNDVPVLVLNGTYDTQTGLAGARHVAHHFPRSYYVELPTIGHAVLFGGDVPVQIARDFLINPLQPPNTNAIASLALEFPPPWPARHDFDGDGRTDPALYHEASGGWQVRLSGSGYGLAALAGFGGPGWLPVSGDFDGDGSTDLALYHEATGYWQVLLSGNDYALASIEGFGGASFVPVSGDFDGDGKTDLAIYDEATGTWRVLLSGSGYGEASLAGFGEPGWLPVSGDFDGDGKTDLAIYDQASGTWRVLLSGSGYGEASLTGFGGPGWLPVSGDFDGDGKADLAIYEEATGTWRVLLSGSGYGEASLTGFGGPGWLPVSGDFDGDGKADLAIYHEESGAWSMLLSGSEYAVTEQHFGGPGYVPVR